MDFLQGPTERVDRPRNGIRRHTGGTCKRAAGRNSWPGRNGSWKAETRSDKICRPRSSMRILIFTVSLPGFPKAYALPSSSSIQDNIGKRFCFEGARHSAASKLRKRAWAFRRPRKGAREPREQSLSTYRRLIGLLG